MVYLLRAINVNGTHAGILPDYKGLSSNLEFSDVGSGEFEYAVHGVNNSLLAHQREIALYDDNVEVPDSRFILEGYNGELVRREGVLYRKWAGRNLWKLFDDTTTYPPSWPSTTTLDTAFANAKPGHILKTFIDKAQARGDLTGVTYNFTATQDSNSVAWTHSISLTYESGISLLKVIQHLVDLGMIEARMVGRQLQVYNPGTLGVDRTVGATPVTLWSSGNVEEVPQAGDSRELKTVALVQGDEGSIVEYVDASAVAAYGRRVLAIKQSGTTDPGMLTAVGQLNIDKVKTPRTERTTKFTITPDGPKPMTTLFPGDWVYSNAGDTLEKMRVRQIVIGVPDAQAEATATLRLNDKFAELEELLNRKIEGITGGAAVGGGGGGLPTGPDSGSDVMPPAIPAGLGLSSITYVHTNGLTYALLYASWLPVTTNADGSALTDLDGYRFAWRYTAESSNVDWHVHSHNDTNTITVSGLLPGRNIQAMVGAVDHNGNFSGWSAAVSGITATDTTPPPVPSTPVVAPYLGQLRVFWDGLGSAGELMPLDFTEVQVHFSTVNNFTPDATTMAGVMVERGYFIITDLTYGTPYFVKLVAKDWSSNLSAPSAQGTATPEFVTGGDIGAGQISYDALAFQQWGNFVVDGSFETTDYRTRAGTQSAITSGRFSFRTDAATDFGFAYLRGHATVSSGVRDYFLLAPDYGEEGPVAHAFRVIPEGTLLGRMMVKSISGNGGAGLVLRWYDRDGTFMSDTEMLATPTGGSWQQYGQYFDVPAFAQWAVPVVRLNAAATTGTWDFDAIEFREVANAWLVKTAAIITAKIADLAVTNAKIASLEVGKLTAGIMIADITVSGRFATALSGQRMEINSTGLHAFNSSGVETVRVSNTGSAFFMGELYSGPPNTKRIRIDATATFNSEAGITFERGTGSDQFQPTIFAHYNTYDGASGGGIHVMSAEVTGNSTGRAELNLYRGGGWELRSIYGSGQAGHVEASGQLSLWAGGVIDIDAGTSSNILVYGRWPVNVGVSADQTLFQNHDSLGGTTTGYTIAYGPTMASLPFVYVAPSPNATIAFRITTLSNTQYGLTYPSVAGSNWRVLIVRT